MTKDKLIEMLIDDDLDDWRDEAVKNSYFAVLLHNGFVGYRNQTGEELLTEVVERGLLELKSNYPECLMCSDTDNYVCYLCEIAQISELRKELYANNES
jgi:hypothetical protein